MFVYEYASGALNYTNKDKESKLPPIQETRNKFYTPIAPKNIRYFSSSAILNKDKVKHPDNLELPLLNEDVQFKTWLINNIPQKIYPNSLNLKEKIYKENRGKSGLYLWECQLNGKYYIGSAKNLTNRLARYFSPKELANTDNLIQRALIKYGHENFSLYILEYTDVKNLIEREQYYIDMLSPQYNILKIAGSSLGFEHSEETKLKMSTIKLNDPKLIEYINNLSDINRGSTKSEEFKANRRAKTTGIHNPMYGKSHSEESRLIMNISKKGVPLTEEHKAKIKDTLAKIGKIDRSKSSKRVYLYLNESPTILFKEFSTYTEAGQYLNCNRSTIYRYIDSNKIYCNKWLLSSYLHNS